jgi:hypothetical protein
MLPIVAGHGNRSLSCDRGVLRSRNTSVGPDGAANALECAHCSRFSTMAYVPETEESKEIRR